jgi:hypothetical protein
MDFPHEARFLQATERTNMHSPVVVLITRSGWKIRRADELHTNFLNGSPLKDVNQ